VQEAERREELAEALVTGEVSAHASAAEAVRVITVPETEVLLDAVAEPCDTDAGAAMTISNWDLAANSVLRYLDEGDPLLLEVAADFATDAVASATEWRRVDGTAC